MATKTETSSLGIVMGSKIMIMGHARSGKDTLAEIIKDEAGLSFEGSSSFCAEAFIYVAIKGILDYRCIEECIEDRVNHRGLWASLIKAYNWDDPARLSREILANNDIYVGIRSRREFDAAKEEGLFGLAIWVDASRRVEDEPSDSFDIDISRADIVIDNNGTEEEFVQRVKSLISIPLNAKKSNDRAFGVCTDGCSKKGCRTQGFVNIQTDF